MRILTAQQHVPRILNKPDWPFIFNYEDRRLFEDLKIKGKKWALNYFHECFFWKKKSFEDFLGFLFLIHLFLNNYICNAHAVSFPRIIIRVLSKYYYDTKLLFTNLRFLLPHSLTRIFFFRFLIRYKIFFVNMGFYTSEDA